MAEAKWTVWVEASDQTVDRPSRSPPSIGDLSSPAPDDLGLRLAEAKDLLLKLQSYLARDQVQQFSAT